MTPIVLKTRYSSLISNSKSDKPSSFNPLAVRCVVVRVIPLVPQSFLKLNSEKLVINDTFLTAAQARSAPFSCLVTESVISYVEQNESFGLVVPLPKNIISCDIQKQFEHFTVVRDVKLLEGEIIGKILDSYHNERAALIEDQFSVLSRLVDVKQFTTIKLKVDTAFESLIIRMQHNDKLPFRTLETNKNSEDWFKIITIDKGAIEGYLVRNIHLEYYVVAPQLPVVSGSKLTFYI
jgi:hypothetical protein